MQFRRCLAVVRTDDPTTPEATVSQVHPGASQAVRGISQVYQVHSGTAADLRAGQVAAMHKIASENTETGQHAETIRAAARRQASSLQAVAVRYARVLDSVRLAPELEQAQAMSIRALNEAEIPYAALNRAVSLPSGPDLTAGQKQHSPCRLPRLYEVSPGATRRGRGAAGPRDHPARHPGRLLRREDQPGQQRQPHRP